MGGNMWRFNEQGGDKQREDEIRAMIAAIYGDRQQ